MEWSEAITAARDGCCLEVEVVPGSRESRFPAGFNEWRGRIEAKVRAPPEDGQANAELVRLVAQALKVPPGRVHVSSGATSRRKTVTVTGLDAKAVVALLAGHFG
ncbi:MAG: DUF167 domain-containing protein [Candidatus Thermoplasmatota archaeon]